MKISQLPHAEGLKNSLISKWLDFHGFSFEEKFCQTEIRKKTADCMFGPCKTDTIQLNISRASVRNMKRDRLKLRYSGLPLPSWQEVQVSAFFFALLCHSGREIKD